MVFRRAECDGPFGQAVLGPVDEGLRVFDPAADLERFEFSRHAGFQQPCGQCAAAQTVGDQNRGGGDGFPVFQNDAFAAPSAHQRSGDPGSETETAAEFDDPFPEPECDLPEPVRTDVRAFEIADLRCRSGGGERRQNKLRSFIPGPGVEFSVGKGSGAPLADQQVCGFGKFPGFQELPVAVVSAVNLRSGVEDQRPGPGHRQRQRREDAGRPGADHYRMKQPRLRQFELWFRVEPGGRVTAGAVHPDRINQLGMATPGVDAFGTDPPASHLRFRNSPLRTGNRSDPGVDIDRSGDGVDLKVLDSFDH